MAPQFPFRLTGLHDEIAARKRLVPLETLKTQAESHPALRDVHTALSAEGVCLIAELPGIPLAGDSKSTHAIPAVLDLYERSGISMVANFAHAYASSQEMPDPQQLREATAVPMISRDIVIDPYQLHELRAYGTDMVTLYADLLNDDQCASLVERAQTLGMEPLIEVTAKEDIPRVANLGARVFAIDARHEHGHVVDTQHFADLRKGLSNEARVIAVSVLPTVGELIDLRQNGCDAVIVGAPVLQQHNAYHVLRRLVAAGVHPAFQVPVPVIEE